MRPWGPCGSIARRVYAATRRDAVNRYVRWPAMVFAIDGRGLAGARRGVARYAR